MEPLMDAAVLPQGADGFDVLDPAPNVSSAPRYDAFISYSHEPDTDIAARIQGALERIAKPMLKRRALRVFRDTTGLGAGGELWPQITAAMDVSEWLVLLCSVRGATVSPDRPDWVGRELRRWLATKGPQRIILVVTDGPTTTTPKDDPRHQGGLHWNEKLNDFDRAASKSLHPVLFGVFSQQPLWADLSAARDDPTMTYEHRGFVESLGQAIGGLHGKPPNEVFGEDLRIHKRTRRLTFGAIAALSGLLVTAVGAGAVAVINEREAVRQRAAATSRGLAAQSMTWTGSRALLLAAEAYDTDPTREANAALLSAIDDSGTAPASDNRSLVASFTHQGAAVASAASIDGAALATLDEDGMLSIWVDAQTRRPRTAVPADAERIAWASTTQIALVSRSSLTWVDAATGVPGATIDIGDRVTALASGATGVLVGTAAGSVARVAPGDASATLVADAHLAAIDLVRETADGVVSADRNGQIIARDADLRPRGTATSAASGFADLSADGSAIVAPTGSYDASDRTTELAVVIDVATGERTGRLATTDAVRPMDAVFTGVGNEIAALAQSDLGSAGFYRADARATAPVVAEAAVIETTGFVGRIAYPTRPTAFLRHLPAGLVAVTGAGATVVSAVADTDRDETGGWELLTGPTLPISVAPATGAMLIRANGLALADLTAVQDQAALGTAPVTELGFFSDSGWLTPDGAHVLAVLDSGGVVAQARPGGEGWLVPEPELSVVPAASLNGRYVAYAVAELRGSSTIVVVEAASGQQVARVASRDPLCAEQSCSSAWRTSHLALSADGAFLAVHTAQAAPSSMGTPAESDAEPQVVLYDLTSGDGWPMSVPEVGGLPGTDAFTPAETQGPVATGVEVARYPAATTSVPTFGDDGVLRFHDGRRSVLSIDPRNPAEAQVSANQASGRWILDASGRPVAAVGCTISVLDDQAQPVVTPPQDDALCGDREVAWIGASRTLVLDASSLLPTDSTTLRALACSLAGRNLTADEWTQFMGGVPYRLTCPDQPAPVPPARATAAVGPHASSAPTPGTDPSAGSGTDAAFGLDRIIVQDGLPNPPHQVSDLTDFAGRADLLSFLRAQRSADVGDERAEAEACFMQPVPPPAPEPVPPPPPPPGVTVEPVPEPEPDITTDPWERYRCVGLISANPTSIVAIDFAGDAPLDWLLLEPDAGQWEVAATYRRSDNPVPPVWVTARLR